MITRISRSIVIYIKNIYIQYRRRDLTAGTLRRSRQQEASTFQEPECIMRESEDAEFVSAVTPASVAGYISTIAGELSQLAKSNGLESLGYILDMARLEAEEISKSE
jgi:hypothetical protein